VISGHRGNGTGLPRTYARAMSIYPPYVIERTSRGERSYDIFSRLLMDRIVFLGSPIDDNVANIIIAQLLFLDAEDPERDVYLYVNSPGGNVYSGLAVYDTMQHLRAPVSTFCVGMAASMAAVLVSAGEKGKRSALPNSRIMIHQPSSGAQGTAADIEIAAKEILHAREKLNEIIAEHTGQPVERIAEDVDRDRFMSPDEALQYGLIDRVIHGPVEERERDPAVAAEKIERSADVAIDEAEEEADS
jgi:ATP-dependent Clp protease protease subunit